MSIIDQAAKRLEELRKAGIELPTGIGQRTTPAANTITGATERVQSSEASEITRIAPFQLDPPPVVMPRPPMPGLREQAPPEHAPNDSPFIQPERTSKEVHIDLARAAAMGFVTPDAPRSQLADEYRVIKRPLLTNALRRSSQVVDRGNLILITSAMPGEGKTFTSINLALSMAVELDCRVLLVDADVARPAVLQRLGLPASRGLLDVLTDSTLDLSDVLLRTNVDRLSILPAGTQHARATEVLASDGMNRLVEELATRYADRIVLFDAPPLLPSTESRVLASHMGQIVLVVQAGRTPVSAVTQAMTALEDCPVVMTLLNKVVGTENTPYFGYYTNAPS